MGSGGGGKHTPWDATSNSERLKYVPLELQAPFPQINTGSLPALSRSMGAKIVCFGRVGSAQKPDLWGPEASVPGVTPAAAPAWGMGSGAGSAEGRAEAQAIKAVIARKRILKKV